MGLSPLRGQLVSHIVQTVMVIEEENDHINEAQQRTSTLNSYPYEKTPNINW